MTEAAEALFRRHQAIRLERLRAVLATGETNPARVLALWETACRVQLPRGHSADFSGRLQAPACAADFTDANLYPACPIMPTGVPSYATANLAGTRTMRPFYGDYDELSLNQLADAIEDHRVDAVVELGADCGQRLLKLFHKGCPPVAYFAAEPTRAGRDGVALLAGVQPDMDLRAVEWDPAAPDWSFLAGFHRVLVFSHLALTAWPDLPADLFDRLTQAAPAVWGVHHEAVGHQVRRDAPHLGWFHAQAAEHGFNRDLVARLVDAHNRGAVQCDFLSPDLYDLSTGFPVTVAWWRAGAARTLPLGG